MRGGELREAELIGLAYQGALDPKAWVAFAEALEVALGHAVVTLAFPQPKPGLGGEFVAPSLARRFVDAYRREYGALDPLRPSDGRVPVGSAYFGDELVSDAEVVATAFYREWMEPQGLLPSPFLGGVVDRGEEDGTSLIGIFRPAGKPRFARRAPRLLQRLLPHLQRAVQIQLRRERLEAEREALVAAFDRVAMGVILVDERGRIRATNRTADQLLARRDGIALWRGGLQAANPEQTATLLGMLAAAARSEPEAESAGPVSLTLSRPSARRPLEAVVARLCETDGWGSGMAALYVSDPEEGVDTPCELLRSLYSLTPSEAALARELASGRSLEESAEGLGVTVGTARQRLGLIFAKTGTSRQAALVRLLLHGPAQLHWGAGRAGRAPVGTSEASPRNAPRAHSRWDGTVPGTGAK